MGGLEWLTKTTNLATIRSGCAKVADRAVKELGEGAQYLQITTEYPMLGDVIEQPSYWDFHVAAYKDGKVYDKLTGGVGMDLADYKGLFKERDVIDFTPSDIRTVK